MADPRGGAHPARAPPISPNDFTDPARPRPLFHRLFTKSCACITIVMHALKKFVSILHKRGSHCGSPSSKKRAANHSVSICRTLYIQRSVILLREHRLAKQKRAAFGFSLSGGNRLVVACACARSQLQYKILRTRGRPRDLIFNQFSIDCCQNAFASAYSAPQTASWRRLGHTCAPPFLTFLDSPLLLCHVLIIYTSHLSHL